MNEKHSKNQWITDKIKEIRGFIEATPMGQRYEMTILLGAWEEVLLERASGDDFASCIRNRIEILDSLKESLLEKIDENLGNNK